MNSTSFLPALIVGALLGIFGLYLLWTERREERRSRKP